MKEKTIEALKSLLATIEASDDVIDFKMGVSLGEPTFLGVANEGTKHSRKIIFKVEYCPGESKKGGA